MAQEPASPKQDSSDDDDLSSELTDEEAKALLSGCLTIIIVGGLCTWLLLPRSGINNVWNCYVEKWRGDGVASQFCDFCNRNGTINYSKYNKRPCKNRWSQRRPTEEILSKMKEVYGSAIWTFN